MPVPVAARSKAYVCGRSPAEIVGSNPTGGMDVCLLWVFVCCQVEVSATSWSLVQRSPTDYGASLCDLENLKNEEAMTRVGSQRHRKKKSRYKYNYCSVRNCFLIPVFLKVMPLFLLHMYLEYGCSRYLPNVRICQPTRRQVPEDPNLILTANDNLRSN
jgi:hypothetical protein